MTAERLVEIFTMMANHERERPHVTSLCSVASQITELSGAGILITSKDGMQTPFCTSNGLAQKLMDLEIAFEEGPGHEACANGTANEVADLLGGEGQRWSFYSREAAELGARAVFGFPIQIGGVVFGALSLYSDSPGPLSSEQSSSAYLMASVIGRAVLKMQAGAPQGALADELQGQSTFDFSVHQASGMLAVQAKRPVRDALVMLRSHAFVLNVSPVALAHRIIDRKTRIDPLTGAWIDLEMENGEESE